MLEQEPAISVVIACLNGEATLATQLDALLAQEADRPFEIIVADNGSIDGTRRLVEEYAARDARVRWVNAAARRGVAAARNIGVQAAYGSVLLFCDDDDRVHSGWLIAYSRVFATGATLASGWLRRVTFHEEVLGEEKSPQLWFGQLGWGIGGNCGVTRELFDELGGFDEEFIAGEDADFSWRAQLAGHELIYVAAAGIDYVQRADRSSLIAQLRGYGEGEVRLYAKYGRLVMKPPQPFRSTAGIIIAGLELIVSPQSRRAAARLGRNLGRLRGALRHRQFRYL